MKELQFAALVV